MALVGYDSTALLNAILAEIEETGSIDDGHNKQLYALFGASFISALNLIDREAVKKMICPANRSFITIAEISSPDKKSIHAPKPQIRCFLKRSYCTCETFSSKVVLSAEMIMCEHLLAANIAERLKIIQQVQLTDEEFGEALYLLRTP
ncbi:Zinc finger SWIM domain-containing protein 7 [Umbelopsis nana]